MKGFFFAVRFYLLVFAAGLLLQACRRPSAPARPVITPKKPAVQCLPAKNPVTSPDSVCIAAVGDIMLGTSYPDSTALPPDSAKNSFKAALTDLRNADVTFGNLEGTLLDTGAPAYFKLHQKSKGFLFRMPPCFAAVLKDAGFDVLSLANNHSNDFDYNGRVSTMKTLDSAGISYGGLLSCPATVFERNGIRYGFCAFAPNAQTSSLLDLKNAARIISGLKQRCDMVIVSFHGGGEGVGFEHVPRAMELYIAEKRGDVYAFAHNAIDAGADIVFGNGPHVNRAMELYRDRLIAYSLGNFCTYKSVSVMGICGLAPLLKVNLDKKGAFLNGQIISFKQTHDKGLVRDTLNAAAIKIKALTGIDFPDAGLSISNTGKITRRPQS